MIPHCLKFIDEADAIAHLATFRTEEGEWIATSHSHALDAIGTIYKPTGNMLPDGMGGEYAEMGNIPGFHVNLLCDELPATCEQFIVTPENPVRVWA